MRAIRWSAAARRFNTFTNEKLRFITNEICTSRGIYSVYKLRTEYTVFLRLKVKSTCGYRTRDLAFVTNITRTVILVQIISINVNISISHFERISFFQRIKYFQYAKVVSKYSFKMSNVILRNSKYSISLNWPHLAPLKECISHQNEAQVRVMFKRFQNYVRARDFRCEPRKGAPRRRRSGCARRSARTSTGDGRRMVASREASSRRMRRTRMTRELRAVHAARAGTHPPTARASPAT